MTELVDEYNDENSQPGYGPEAEPADDDGQNQGGPMNHYHGYGTRKIYYQTAFAKMHLRFSTQKTYRQYIAKQFQFRDLLTVHNVARCQIALRSLNRFAVSVKVIDLAQVEFLDPGLNHGAVADDEQHHLLRQQPLLRQRRQPFRRRRLHRRRVFRVEVITEAVGHGVADLLRDPARRLVLARERHRQVTLREFYFVHSRGPRLPNLAQLLHELLQRFLSHVGADGREHAQDALAPGQERERRRAICVALLFAQIHVDARRELAAE